jgi:hypothetical protein
MKNWLFSFFCLIWSMCANSEEQYSFTRVLHDPFQKPAIQEKKTIEQQTSEVTQNQLAQPPNLIATMLAGRHSMANVDGKIIKLGETINGYTLVQVESRKAVFVKNKKYIYLSIDNETNE